MKALFTLYFVFVQTFFLCKCETILHCMVVCDIGQLDLKSISARNGYLYEHLPSATTMKTAIVLLLACLFTLVRAHPPHPDVVAVRHEEELLPPILRKPALHNPHLRELLTLSSSLHHGEKLVYQREAHDVSRKEIYSMLTHAGFIPRQKYAYPSGSRYKLNGIQPPPPESIESFYRPTFATHDIIDLHHL